MSDPIHPPNPRPIDADATITHADIAQPISNPASQSAASHEPEIRIDGYRILNEISRGGQAVVFAATFLRTGRKVAVKVMREGPLATEASRARFTREVEILASLNHPNIVTIIDRGRSADGSEYFTMDYIEGIPLDEAVWKAPEKRQNHKTNPAATLQLFLKICDAVNAAHLRGIVHRDLKPSNIRVDERGEPHILDFGLARGALTLGAPASVEPLTLTGQFLGSLPWASPEQAEGISEKIDSRTDVYSLGVILYQLVTGGHFPYQVAGSMRDVLNNIMTADPPAPSAILAARETRDLKRHARRAAVSRAMLNPVLDAIILRTLAKRRDERYQSAGELARDIESYLAGRPTLAGGRTRKTSRRPLLIAAALAVVGAIPVAWFITHRSTALAPRPVASAPSSKDLATQAAAHQHALVAASSLAAEYQDLQRIMGQFVPITAYINAHASERFDAWRAAAERGDPVGQLLLARCYDQGAAVAPNPREASRYLRLAADQGLPMALCLLGIRFRTSAPPIQDFPLAISWYRRAADAGDGRAMVDLGIMFLQGLGTIVDYPEAMRWFRKAADRDVPAAFNLMGDMYANGYGVPIDNQTAITCYRRGADGGAPGAMASLGLMYATGRGATQDFEQALYWFKKADAFNAPWAAYGLAELYANGQGVPLDVRQAAVWYQKAAAANIPRAMRKLAALYEQGRGLPKDPDLAFNWYTKAAAAGDTEAKQWLTANSNRNK